jgi:hypothetical protein
VPATFKCPACANAFRLPDGFQGGNIICPMCQGTVAIPAAASADGTVPIRFECPTCKAVHNARSNRSGEKIACLKCGQRLQIPEPPPQPRPTSKTVLAPLLDGPSKSEGIKAAPPPLPKSPPDPASADDSSFEVPTATSTSSASPAGRREHSGLGMASFIFALLVGGLDLIVGFIIVLRMASSADGPNLLFAALSGAMALACLNVLSIPLCLVGGGLAFVGLVAHRDRNHLFSWIGLLGNGAVIVCVIGLYVAGAILDAANQRRAPQQQKQPPPIFLNNKGF